MPEYSANYYESFYIGEVSVGFYYNSKTHRYLVSLNYGEETIEFTRKEGEAIKCFLKFYEEYIKKIYGPQSKIFSTSWNSKNLSTSKEADSDAKADRRSL
jgi:hypothetical protein